MTTVIVVSYALPSFSVLWL